MMIDREALEGHLRMLRQEREKAILGLGKIDGAIATDEFWLTQLEAGADDAPALSFADLEKATGMKVEAIEELPKNGGGTVTSLKK